MKRLLIVLLFFAISLSCHKPAIEINAVNIPKQEVEATIIRFDYSKHICGFSWIIQAGAKQYRAKAIPESFQRPNQAVWIKYEEVPDDGANCGFIVLISTRLR